MDPMECSAVFYRKESGSGRCVAWVERECCADFMGVESRSEAKQARVELGSGRTGCGVLRELAHGGAEPTEDRGGKKGGGIAGEILERCAVLRLRRSLRSLWISGRVSRFAE